MAKVKLIGIENASFSYKKINVFENINLQLNEGEVLCLVGPNGCGKTTLMNCILGVNSLNTGQVLLNEKNISSLKPYEIAKKIAYVPQSHEATFPYSVIEIVLMGRAAYTSMFTAPDDEDIKIAENALDMVGMLKFKDRIYTELSGGEAQMVMIARALAQQTSIIAMDEPTAHLDFKHELIILETIVDLIKNKKISIIMATHFLNHAFYLENNGIKTKVAVIYNGKLAGVGTPSEVLSKQNMSNIFNINAKVVSYENAVLSNANYIIPLSTKGRTQKCN